MEFHETFDTEFENWALYNCIDGAVTMKCWNAIKEEAYDEPFGWAYKTTIELLQPLIYMMTRGVKIDLEKLEETKKHVEADIRDRKEKLAGYTQKHGVTELNTASPKQCIAYFYGTLGNTPYLNNGRPTTDDKALARLVRKGIPEAKLVQEIRGLDKLRGTYLDVVLDDDKRLRCSYNARGTRNGRLSSSQTIFGTGMNLQNLHPAFKGFLIADENHMMFEIDKAQAEWVVTAYACGDANMIAALESGEDVHAHTAHLITGAPIELINKEKKILGHETDQDRIFQLRMEQIPELFEEASFVPRSMACRQAGKKSNHGLNYAMGFKRFALENEFPEKESRQIVDGYRGAYPMLPIWWDTLERKLKKDRMLTNCFGRTRRFLATLDHNTLKDAIAYIPQSTVVDLVNGAMIKIYNDRSDIMMPVDMLMQTHDSITIQLPVGNWKNMALALLKVKEYMNPTLDYNGRKFQIGTDIKWGLNAGEQDANRNPYGMREMAFLSNPDQLAELLEAEYGKATR